MPRRVFVVARADPMTSTASNLDIPAAVFAPDALADGPVQQPPAGRGTGRGRGRGRGAGRGRGGAPNPQPLPPGSPEYPLHKWSITIGRRGAVCPGSWLSRMGDYMSAHCKAGGAAFEVGGSAKRLHIQAVVRIRSEQTEAFKKQLSEHIKNFRPMLRGERGTVGCMFLQDHHTWSPMLGYIQKDKRQGHFELRTHHPPKLVAHTPQQRHHVHGKAWPSAQQHAPFTAQHLEHACLDDDRAPFFIVQLQLIVCTRTYTHGSPQKMQAPIKKVRTVSIRPTPENQ